MKTANGQCLTLESREKNDVIPVLLSRHPSSLLFLSSQCLDYLDPENLTLNKWLHNKD
ncbi:hypothetical protein [Wolbachia endosymbiont of Aedes albopictus]|uniref:hypothetical protein n=1 Tax=Wolbachia endosymbiont of Aedes albopictus TaxID=167957 RepID=UPI00216A9DC3|nr:hypothetical protein [Wolbachia endosymbiont of Aedes albopictus]UVW83636.1 hypothetical protein NHG98_04650 [Wolbachia endosymbiont of Aedes albopictus]